MNTMQQESIRHNFNLDYTPKIFVQYHGSRDFFKFKKYLHMKNKCTII